MEKKLLELIKKIESKSRRVWITLEYENSTRIQLEPNELIEVLTNKTVFKYIAKIFQHIEIMILPDNLSYRKEKEIKEIKKEGVEIEVDVKQTNIDFIKIRIGYVDDGMFLYFPTIDIFIDVLGEIYEKI